MKFSKEQFREAAHHIAFHYQYPDDLDTAKRITAQIKVETRFYQTLLHAKVDDREDTLRICKRNLVFSSVIAELQEENYIFPDPLYYNLKVQKKEFKRNFRKPEENYIFPDPLYDNLKVQKKEFKRNFRKPLADQRDLTQEYLLDYEASFQESNDHFSVSSSEENSFDDYEKSADDSSEDTKELPFFSKLETPMVLNPLAREFPFLSTRKETSVVLNPLAREFPFFPTRKETPGALNPLAREFPFFSTRKETPVILNPLASEENGIMLSDTFDEDEIMLSDTFEDTIPYRPSTATFVPARQIDLNDKCRSDFSELSSMNSAPAVFLCGGAVLDLLEKKESRDFDYVISSVSDSELKALDYNKHNIKKNAYYLKKPWLIDLRILPYMKKGSCSWMAQDIKNRDFTICKLYADEAGNVYDPCGKGLSDFENRILSMDGNEVEKLADSPVRIIRAMKYIHRGYEPDEALAAALKSFSGLNSKAVHLFNVTQKLLAANTENDNHIFLSNLKRYHLTGKLFGLNSHCSVEELIHRVNQGPKSPELSFFPGPDQIALERLRLFNIMQGLSMFDSHGRSVHEQPFDPFNNRSQQPEF